MGTVASSTGRHFQVQYDGSHFTGVGGVASPVLITHVKLRGEDTEHNGGGQTFTNVTASLYSTSLESAVPLNTTFTTNLLPGASVAGTVALPIVGTSLLGVDLFAQYVVLDGMLASGGPIITTASNAIRTTIGLQ